MAEERGARPFRRRALLAGGAALLLPGVARGAADGFNARPVPHPGNAHPPGLLSFDSRAFGTRHAHLAPSIAVFGSRVWIAAMGQNTRPGGSGEGADSFVFLRWSDDPSAGGSWREGLYVVPPLPGRSVMDPQLLALPGGALLVLYATGNVPPRERRACYGFVVENALAPGGFVAGRHSFLGFGVPGRPSVAGGAVALALDEWQVAKRFGHLTIRPEGLGFTHLGTLPEVERGITAFYETSVVALDGHRTLGWWRTREGLHASRTEDGGRSWSPPGPWAAFPTPNSRASFLRLPSGRIAACFNADARRRVDLTLALSGDGGATWPWTTLVDGRRLRAQSPQYPALDADGRGFVWGVYDFGRGERAETGKQIVVFRVAETDILAGRGQEGVERFVAAE